MLFYAYKNTYDKRIYVYKISALVGSVFIFILSLIFNKGSNVKSVQFTVSYYPFGFMAFFYFLCAVIIGYIIVKVVYVIKRGNDISFLLQGNMSEYRKHLITLFVKRHISFLLFFIICYLPNNLILFLQIFMSYKICYDCQYFSAIIYLISLSGTISFMIKLSEPYMQKYFKNVYNFVFRKEDENNSDETGNDYSDLYQDDRKMLPYNEDDEIDIDKIKQKRKINIEMKPVTPMNKLAKFSSTDNINDMVNIGEFAYKEMEILSFFQRMIGLSLTINQNQQYDFDHKFSVKMKSYLPWEDECYNEKSKFHLYTSKDVPEWMTAGKEKSKIIILK